MKFRYLVIVIVLLTAGTNAVFAQDEYSPAPVIQRGQTRLELPSESSWWCSGVVINNLSAEISSLPIYQIPFANRVEFVHSEDTVDHALFQGEYVQIFFLEESETDIFVSYRRYNINYDGSGIHSRGWQGITYSNNIEIIDCPQELTMSRLGSRTGYWDPYGGPPSDR